MSLKLGVPSKGRLMEKTFDWFAERGVRLAMGSMVSSLCSSRRVKFRVSWRQGEFTSVSQEQT